MHLYFFDLEKHIWMSGFAANRMSVGDILGAIRERVPGVDAQIVDLDRVAGSHFLAWSVYNALKSFQSGHSISRTLEIEILLYLAAEHQIKRAIDLVGVSERTRKVAGIIVGASEEATEQAGSLMVDLLGGRRSDSLLDDWTEERIREVLRNLRIGERELAAARPRRGRLVDAIERLAIERSALLVAVR